MPRATKVHLTNLVHPLRLRLPAPLLSCHSNMKRREIVTCVERGWGRKVGVGEKRLSPRERVSMTVCGDHDRETGRGLVFSLTGKSHSRLPGFGTMDNCLYVEKYNQTILTYCLSFKHLIECRFLDGNFDLHCDG